MNKLILILFIFSLTTLSSCKNPSNEGDLLSKTLQLYLTEIINSKEITDEEFLIISDTGCLGCKKIIFNYLQDDKLDNESMPNIIITDIKNLNLLKTDLPTSHKIYLDSLDIKKKVNLKIKNGLLISISDKELTYKEYDFSKLLN
jgi:hypothetical protein